jgi:predicted O-methyltransferase YrrM
MRPELDDNEHVPEERAEHFMMHDGGSTEVEYLELLKSLVRVFKPNSVLETGALRGWGTKAIVEGMNANGFGHVWTVEFDPQWVNYTRKRLTEEKLIDRVTIVEGDSRIMIPWTDQKFDFAFFDSELGIRCEEFEICLREKSFNKGAWAAFHDTSRLRSWMGKRDAPSIKFWKEMDEAYVKYNITQKVEFPLSRGLLLLKVPEL